MVPGARFELALDGSLNHCLFRCATQALVPPDGIEPSHRPSEGRVASLRGGVVPQDGIKPSLQHS